MAIRYDIHTDKHVEVSQADWDWAMARIAKLVEARNSLIAQMQQYFPDYKPPTVPTESKPYQD